MQTVSSSYSRVSGGYTLLGQKEDVSFLRVIHAIEGTASLFHCDLEHMSSGCLIQGTRADAEQALERHLQEKKLVDLTIHLDQKWLAAFTNAFRSFFGHIPDTIDLECL